MYSRMIIIIVVAVLVYFLYSIFCKLEVRSTGWVFVLGIICIASPPPDSCVQLPNRDLGL